MKRLLLCSMLFLVLLGSAISFENTKMINEVVAIETRGINVETWDHRWTCYPPEMEVCFHLGGDVPGPQQPPIKD